jgi:hypothetical protein
MRCYTTQHPFSCGIDLHTRTRYVCLLNQGGEVLGPRNMTARPETFLHVIAPYRPGMVVAVACLFPWDWLADRWADAGLPVVLGHALSMQAIQGGQAKHDKIDSPKIAALLRGGMLPQASGYPAELRAPRALLRRRLALTRQRAEWLAHIQNTNSQDNLPESGPKLAYTAHRPGVAERFPAPAVPQSLDVALALLGYDDPLLSEVE